MILAQTLNGLVFGMILFLLASGLSVIFGLMNVVNLAHGSFYMLGAYIGLSISLATKSFWIALLAAPPLVAILGLLAERTLLRPLYRRGHLDQVLLTFGVAIFVNDLVKWLWGAEVRSVIMPSLLTGRVNLGIGDFPIYRLFLIAVGIALAVVLWWVLDRSRLGAIVRAGVDDAQMVSALGINVTRVFALVFAIGAGLAGLSGVLAAPVFSLFPGMDFAILITALIVVVVGGMGTLKGALVGSLLIGMADAFGKIYLPGFSLAMVYLVMAAVLLVRPSGLLGKAA